MKKIPKLLQENIVRNCYIDSCYHTNGNSIDVIFRDGSQSNPHWGDKFNMIASLLQRIQSSYPEYGLKFFGLNSDGDWQNYIIAYNYCDYDIILQWCSSRGSFDDIMSSTSVTEFVNHINEHIIRINE